MKNKIYIFNIVILLLFASLLYSEKDPFEEMQSDFDKKWSEYQTEGHKKFDDIDKKYDDWLKEQNRIYNEWKKEVQQKWDTFKESTIEEWVEYSGDKKARSVVDYKDGNVTVEVLTETGKAENVIAKIKNVVENIFKKDDYMAKQLDKSKDDIIKDIKQNKNKLDQKKYKSKEGKKFKKTKYKVKMLPNHLEVRAAKYKKVIEENAKKWDMKPELITAVIHTESYFNPKAKSYIPAFGLMQLVPKSGARDAYKHLYKRDKFLSSKYLYNPLNNIELGTAYLDKIMNVYFKEIKSKTSRMYCAIAAYNTGAGNVCKAFTGKTKINSAVKKINKLNAEEVYNYLIKHLPYDETKHYLKRVKKRMKIYKGWL